MTLARAGPHRVRTPRSRFREYLPYRMLEVEQLANLVPAGNGEYIRGAGYRQSRYTHEAIAEIYALLMARRRRGEGGEPTRG
jgi:hypothetical protein